MIRTFIQHEKNYQGLNRQFTRNNRYMLQTCPRRTPYQRGGVSSAKASHTSRKVRLVLRFPRKLMHNSTIARAPGTPWRQASCNTSVALERGGCDKYCRTVAISISIERISGKNQPVMATWYLRDARLFLDRKWMSNSNFTF